MGLQDDVFDLTADVMQHCPEETQRILVRVTDKLWTFEALYEKNQKELENLKSGLKIVGKYLGNE